MVKEGKIFLNEPTDLPEGTNIQLVEKKSPFQPLTQQIEDEKIAIQQVPMIEEVSTQKVQEGEKMSEDRDSPNKFDKFGFHELINQGVTKVGYTSPTLVQDQAIQSIIDRKDILGIAKTGSGKTAAFALPILNNLLNQKLEHEKLPNVLVLSPTRELAIQIGVSFENYGLFTNIKQITIFGGVNQKHQVDQLQKRDAQILVATPGRLLDLINQKYISLDHVQILVLDEADRMLDMGFIPDIKRIVSKIPQREQSLLFSATMPKAILKLAESFLKTNYVHVTGDQQSIPINKIKQEIYFVEKEDKLALLENILEHDNISKTLIFSRTKHGADKLARKLQKQSYSIEAMHGNKSQASRQRVLKSFKDNNIQILVATDLAARGLDVDDISHVINYDIPSEPETYMHRIGRTARAGKSGIAISFCQNDQRKYFPQIEQLLGFHIPRAIDNPFQSVHEEPLPTKLGVKLESRKRNKQSKMSEKSNRGSWKKKSRQNKEGDKKKNYKKFLKNRIKKNKN